jgi:glycosyltransferase involved in cell wall biosynthesis
MKRVLLVPDLPIERWPSMDRYASRLFQHLQRHATDLDVRLAGEISTLTTEGNKRQSGPIPLPLLPAPGMQEIRRYLSRYLAYPWRVRARRADLVHVLDHSYAHVLRSVKRVPRIVTVHDLVPVLMVQRAAGGFKERLRNRLLGWVLDGLRRADAWVVATEWMRTELAQWLGKDDRISVIPYGVDDHFFSPPAESRDEVRKRLGIPGTAYVVLHVGSVGPRKNPRQSSRRYTGSGPRAPTPGSCR